MFASMIGLLSTLVGFALSHVSKLAFPLVTALMIYPLYYLDLKKGTNWRAANHVLLWALFSSITLTLLTIILGEETERLILHGEAYKEEMFRWIETGIGAEGDPHLFILPKIKELAIFSSLCLVSAGFLGLFLGSFLLNYMNYYVGCLFIHTKPGFLWVPVLFSWPIYAILRVIGYVNLGVVLSTPLFSRLFKAKFDRDQVRKQLLLAAIMIGLDFILKGSVANAIYQPILRKATEF